MKTTVYFILSVCVFVASGYRLKKEHPKSTAYSIQYTGKHGQSRTAGRQSASMVTSMTQTIVIQGEEIQLTDDSGTDIVVDYKQNILLGKHANDDSCIMMSLKNILIPSMETIEFMVNASSYFGTPLQYPQLNVKLNVQKSKNQKQPVLSPLSRQLCGDNTVIVLDQKLVRGGLRKAEKHGVRPKRDIGWGEIALIVLVIILL
ncbi:hypothetical protein ACF0H5_012290 [Mactra antiquata]